MAYEDAPISEAHRKALEAGRKLFESKGQLKLPRPGILQSDRPGCSVYLDAANGAYAAAAEAAFSGTEAEWIAAMQEASLWSHAYNTCLMSTVYTTDEVFG
jgi:hypothetical protein